MEDAHLQRQAEIERALVNRLVETTPETWKHFRLILTFIDDGLGREAISHEIRSLEGRAEVVCATSEIFEATASLSEHLRACGKPLISAEYEVSQLPTGAWRWHSLGCCRFHGHLVKVEDEAGGGLWEREGSSAGSSSLRP